MIHKPLLAVLAILLLAAGVHAQTPCGTITITNGDELAICRGETIELTQTNDLTDPVYTWSPAASFDDATDASPVVLPQASGFYRVRATGSNGCSVIDSVYIDVDNLVVPELIADATVCEGNTIDLLATPVTDGGNTLYSLFGGDSLLVEDSEDPNFSVTILQDSTFTVVAASENGACEERRTVDITVTPGVFEITQDTAFACLGTDSITLSVTVSPAATGDITWRPARFTNGNLTGTSIRVLPRADITYYAEATVNGCDRIDSVAVRLDSLPQDLSMMLDPEKDPYCQGDTFYVLSPVYDVGDFPLITHQWSPAPGIQSPEDLYNGVFIGQDTAELVRITTNGACSDTTSITVNVVEPPVVTFEPANPVVCPGEELQITATFESGEGTLSWEDPLGTLSCTDCLDPVATVQETTTYTIQTETEASQCSSELTYTIEVEPNLNPQLTDATLLCAGDSRVLILGGVVTGNTYRITGGGIDTTDPNVLVTPTETTTYTIETTSRCGVSEQTVTLTIANDYTVEATAPDAVCAGDPVTLSAQVNPAIGGTYTWTLPSGITRTGQQITEDDPAAGTYTVTFTDELGCSSATDVVTLEIIGEDIVPEVQISLEDGTLVPNGGTVFAGGTVTLSGFVDNAGNFTYSWSGNYSPSSAEGPNVEVSIPRTDETPQPLSYTLTVTSEEGCVFEVTVFLNVEQSRVEAPDFFSPDSDGRNDRFRLFYNGTITDYTMIVYDRWGQKVFTSDDPQEGWDGTKDGTPQPADVYLYLAKFRQDGIELQEDGEVTLVR